MESYFETNKNQGILIKILVGIIAVMLLLNIVAFKLVANIAENKTINIQVPQTMDAGEYIIGSDRSSDSVYKMWGRLWLEQLTNFSYKNIDEKIKYIEPFLNTQTIFKNKSTLQELAEAIKTNFITQEFKIREYEVTRLKKGFVKIEAKGKIYRKIGLKKDKLNAIPFVYTIIAYTKNGQAYIKNLNSHIDKTKDSELERQLKENPYVNFDDMIEKNKLERQKKRDAKGGK